MYLSPAFSFEAYITTSHSFLPSSTVHLVSQYPLQRPTSSSRLGLETNYSISGKCCLRGNFEGTAAHEWCTL